jgi:hypothetical protein
MITSPMTTLLKAFDSFASLTRLNQSRYIADPRKPIIMSCRRWQAGGCIANELLNSVHLCSPFLSE